jgi:basic amino acid/polyamine antiporter, APA family
VSVLTLPRRNPALARSVTVVPNIRVRRMVATLGVIVLAGFLAVHTWKDLTGPAEAWYFRSTPVWAVVMALGSLIYWREVGALRRAGVDLRARFAALPPE